MERFDPELIQSTFHPDFVEELGKFIDARDVFAEWELDLHEKTHLRKQHSLMNLRYDLANNTALTAT